EQELFIVLEEALSKKPIFHVSNANSGIKFVNKGKEMTSSLLIKVNYQGGSLPIKGVLPYDFATKLRGGPYTVLIYRKTSDEETEIIGTAKTFLM
ncbi:MAG: hypothetical protein AAFR87_31325, partial [Bacteroidota bacterium]